MNTTSARMNVRAWYEDSRNCHSATNEMNTQAASRPPHRRYDRSSFDATMRRQPITPQSTATTRTESMRQIRTFSVEDGLTSVVAPM
jgi:hypothetical protein